MPDRKCIGCRKMFNDTTDPAVVASLSKGDVYYPICPECTELQESYAWQGMEAYSDQSV